MPHTGLYPSHCQTAVIKRVHIGSAGVEVLVFCVQQIQQGALANIELIFVRGTDTGG